MFIPDDWFKINNYNTFKNCTWLGKLIFNQKLIALTRICYICFQTFKNWDKFLYIMVQIEKFEIILSIQVLLGWINYTNINVLKVLTYFTI